MERNQVIATTAYLLRLHHFSILSVLQLFQQVRHQRPHRFPLGFGIRRRIMVTQNAKATGKPGPME